MGYICAVTDNSYICVVISIGNICTKTRFGAFPRGVMVKAMDCRIVVSKFGLQLRYYVHFRTNTLGKDVNTLILPAMG